MSLSFSPAGGFKPPPPSISGLVVWWDFSEKEGTFVWEDEARTTPITNGATMRGVTDRSGNGEHGDISGQAGNNPGTWDSGVRSSNGAFNAAGIDLVDTVAIQADGMTPISQVYTMIGVAEVPVIHTTAGHVLVSHMGAAGSEIGIEDTGNSGEQTLATFSSSPSYSASTQQDPSWTTHAGEWFMWIAEINGASSTLTFNNADSTPAFTGHNASDIGTSTFRAGGGIDGSANLRSGWNAYIGEALMYNKALSVAERNTLYAYMQSKWALSDSV